MKLSVIIGSHRKNSQSAKVGHYIIQQVAALKLFDNTYLLDLANNDLPFWDEEYSKNGHDSAKQWKPVEEELRTSDAYIIVTPEWGGMVPAKLKNLLLIPKPDVMGHKPALIVSVSSGFGGSYPVNELRTSGYKNTRICYIPEHIIIRHVEEVLNTVSDPESEDDSRIRQRIDYILGMLAKYAEAFTYLKKSDFDFFNYSNGM